MSFLIMIKRIVKNIIPPSITYILLGWSSFADAKQNNDIIEKCNIPRQYRYNFYGHMKLFRNSSCKVIHYTSINTTGGYKIILSKNKLQFVIEPNYPGVACEIFCLEIYKFHHTELFNTQNKYTVFDIGANRGYSSLYFAENNCDISKTMRPVIDYIRR